MKLLRFLKLFIASVAIGTLVSLIVCLYKFCAHHIIHISHSGYALLRENLWFVPLILAALFCISLLLCKIYTHFENFKGGGIPNAILASKGKKTLFTIADSVGAFVMSLFSFLLGLPLGNEGPCVQMGAAISSGVGKAFSRDKEAEKALISSGACAGFSAAVGGGLSGVFFCLDEIEHRPKFSILFCSVISSVSCAVLMRLICPVLSISATIFPTRQLPEFSVKDIWIAFLVGGVFALFSVGFLKSYKLFRGFFIETLCKIPTQYKIFSVLAVSLFAGLASFSFISTGNEIASQLFVETAPIGFLLSVIVIRSILTFSANINSLSGGIFIPLIAVGVTFGTLVFLMCSSFLSPEYYPLVLMLSVSSCVASMMKMPLVSVALVLETFLCPQYLSFIIIASGISYLLPALLKVHSINEIIMESKK